MSAPRSVCTTRPPFDTSHDWRDNGDGTVKCGYCDASRSLSPSGALLPEREDNAPAREPLTAEREAEIRERWTSALYDSIHAFQMAAQLGGLQHAQMRTYLAEHLRDFLLGDEGPVTALLAEVERLRAERDEFCDRVDTLTEVAKGNKRHVAELFAQLQTTQRERDEARARIAELEQHTTTVRAETLSEAANALACLGPVESLTSAPHAWDEAVETLRRMAAESGEPGDVDEMAASLRRDGFGPDEIAEMRHHSTEGGAS
ncbi:hypothetical protein F0L17_14260 [Streptomyces sp. TRM43335]|uniref:Uncharacterized protein n=1 Tax=Streptomyces taklimakanensis TaxID=2569853 RepID=A0A6G2BD91_9ACTN|nr:hypothetical protein [Streptomyces taklimakanensis]MTE20251.1 hypothetical protein [Streptomyces taklimakanensis]